MRRKVPGFVLAAVAAMAVGSAWAPCARAEDVKSVLHKLDVAAANFHSTQADFKIEVVTTDPIPETEVQTGTVYYERKGTSFQTAAHIHQVDGKPVPKTYMFSGGELKLWEGGALDQVTTIAKANKFESYLMLGFGASGKDLESKWDIKYDGDETVDRVKTAKLELVPKDPAVRRNLPKVIVWMDMTRAISLKQYFDEGQGQSRTATYSNVKMNQTLPGDAFTFPTDKKTQYVRR